MNNRNGKNDNKKIPEPAIPRLSLYYRSLLEPRKTNVISSEELANLTGVTASQVRRDLTYFGQFGTPGKGYNIKELQKHIVKILGTDKSWNVALVGVGNLGAAFLSYNRFREQGFDIISAFDIDVRKIGKEYEKVIIQDISELDSAVKENGIRIAIVAVPIEVAKDVIDLVVEAGIKAILNFTPIRPQTPEDVQVLNMDVTIILEQLAYFLTKENKEAFFLP